MEAQGYVSAEEVRRALRVVYAADPEANLRTAFAEALADDLKPLDSRGRWKPSPMLLLIAVVLLGLAGIFLYFTSGGPR